MSSENEKISFTDYWKSLNLLASDVRYRICDRLEISYRTFYKKMNNNSFTQIELEAIDKILAEFNLSR